MVIHEVVFESLFIRWPWEHTLIHQQPKWPLNLPLTSLVIVLPDEVLPQQQPKVFLTLGWEGDDSRSEWSRQ